MFVCKSIFRSDHGIQGMSHHSQPVDIGPMFKDTSMAFLNYHSLGVLGFANTGTINYCSLHCITFSSAPLSGLGWLGRGLECEEFDHGFLPQRGRYSLECDLQTMG